ncbi:MAG: hypothetical protein M3N93_15275 [Acidobacteriota bacterium]|nr:hypothetical protein [Acidobacteriota bacterium]
MNTAAPREYSWRKIEVSLLSDASSHMGHVIHFGDRWYAFEAIHKRESGDDFAFVGDYLDEAAARHAIEQLSILSGKERMPEAHAEPNALPGWGAGKILTGPLRVTADDGPPRPHARPVSRRLALHGAQTPSALTHFWEQETKGVQIAAQQGAWTIARRRIRELVTLISAHAAMNRDPVFLAIEAAARQLGKSIVQRHPVRIAESFDKLMKTFASGRMALRARPETKSRAELHSGGAR